MHQTSPCQILGFCDVEVLDDFGNCGEYEGFTQKDFCMKNEAVENKQNNLIEIFIPETLFEEPKVEKQLEEDEEWKDV